MNVVKLAASQAVARTGNERLVMQSDIKSAIAQVKSAKEKIGSTVIEQQPITTVKTVKPDELPSDVRERFQQIVGNQQAKSEDFLESPANNFSNNGDSSSHDAN